MHSIASARRVGLLLLLGAGVVSGQSTLPAIRPTEAPKPGHLAQVVYSQGQLEVSADNSSLNQILRDVSRLTGMKIIGGLIDERVFGKYGPSAPAEVLANLLSGTSSNMLLTETATYAPSELILTPRQDGSMPLSPNAASSDDGAASSEPQMAVPPSQETSAVQPAAAPTPEAAVNPNGQQVAAQGVSATATPSSTPGASGSTDVRTSDTVSPEPPNMAETPRQIYLQLQQLQQQQQQQQAIQK